MENIALQINSIFKTTSKVNITLSGIKLNEPIQIHKHIHQDYIKEVLCTKLPNNEISITATISKGDNTDNYLIATEFSEFIIKLFAMFGNNVFLEDFTVTPPPCMASCKVNVGFNTPEVTEGDVNVQAEKLLKITDKDLSVLINDLVESQRHISFNSNYEMIHRFRTLFAIFDNIAPPNAYGNIDYDDTDLQDIFCGNVKKTYIGQFRARLKKALDTFIQAGLVSHSKTKSYQCSDNLKDAIAVMPEEEIINRAVTEKTLRCIQQVRNELNHGSFGLANKDLIYWSYELVLPVVQEYLKRKMS